MTSGTVVGRRDPISKGVLHQSVAPRIARKRPAAGTNARRFVTGDQNSGRVIGKAAPLPPRGALALRRSLANGAKQESPRVAEAWAKKAQPVAKFSLKGAFSGFKSGASGKSLTVGPLSTSFTEGQKAGALALKHKKPLGYAGAGVGGMAAGSYLSKRHGDPEDARMARLGAASAASGIGAAYLGRKAVKGPLRVRRMLKDPKVRENLRAKAAVPGGNAEARALLNLLGGGKAPVMVGGRSAVYGAGALAAAGGSAAAARSASDRRWN